MIVIRRTYTYAASDHHSLRERLMACKIPPISLCFSNIRRKLRIVVSSVNRPRRTGTRKRVQKMDFTWLSAARPGSVSNAAICYMRILFDPVSLKKRSSKLHMGISTYLLTRDFDSRPACQCAKSSRATRGALAVTGSRQRVNASPSLPQPTKTTQSSRKTKNQHYQSKRLNTRYQPPDD